MLICSASLWRRSEYAGHRHFYEGCALESQDGLQAGDEFYTIDGERVYIYSDVAMLLARNTTGL
ncbi:MAG: hypothetical protein V8T01_01940 [Oscillospiraceae bacterium]